MKSFLYGETSLGILIDLRHKKPVPDVSGESINDIGGSTLSQQHDSRPVRVAYTG